MKSLRLSSAIRIVLASSLLLGNGPSAFAQESETPPPETKGGHALSPSVSIAPFYLLNGLELRAEAHVRDEISVGLRGRKSLWKELAGGGSSSLFPKETLISAHGSFHWFDEENEVGDENEEDGEGADGQNSWLLGPAVGFRAFKSVVRFKTEEEEEKVKKSRDVDVTFEKRGPHIQLWGGRQWVWSNGLLIRAAAGAGYWFYSDKGDVPADAPKETKTLVKVIDAFSRVAFETEVAVGYQF